MEIIYIDMSEEHFNVRSKGTWGREDPKVERKRLLKMTACNILEIDTEIEWLMSLSPDPLKGDFKKEIEILKQQKIDLYENATTDPVPGSNP